MLYRRSIFLVNKRFQLRFAFYVCSWLVGLSLAYPLIISNLFDYFLRYLALDPLGPALPNIQRTRDELLWLLVIMQLILLSLTFLISIFMSHKIAGPLYKLTRSFQAAKEGNLDQKVVFRKKDYFQDIADEYNQMMDQIKARLDRSNEGISEAIPYLEKSLTHANPEIQEDLNLVLRKLREAQKV